MTDSLRTRIAAVLYRQHYRYGNPNDITWDELEADLQDRYLEDADAVIRELEAGYILVPKSATLIAEAKAAYAAIPAERRADLERRFNDAQDAALHHQEYRRD